MTTHELISQLSAMPKDLPVLICQDGITFDDGGHVGSGEYLTPIVDVEVLPTADAVNRRVVRQRQPGGGVNGGAVLIRLPQ
jgi:hypothetical protein